ncbi:MULTISPECIES: hypothetical protein [unclassified Helicobacter]|uniref:hypothetical protein n=1 Tax=unclassified Helicobacter TaxID=2593540 RepID=UPI0013152B41|nr:MULTISPECIES: hypothetical protein [unclassified Helicobacter]
MRDFKSCEALSARSYLSGNDEVRKANSLKSRKKPTRKTQETAQDLESRED